MAELADSMSPLEISTEQLKDWGDQWLDGRRFDKKQGVNFARFIDEEFARALSEMLGSIPVVEGSGTALLPPEPDCVELGPVRVIGGIRPQNFDAAYRPDGPRVIFDSKTLNDLKSVGKNWQNMVNDLATEAATVHTRFPYALVGFDLLSPASKRLTLSARLSAWVLGRMSWINPISRKQFPSSSGILKAEP